MTDTLSRKELFLKKFNAATSNTINKTVEDIFVVIEENSEHPTRRPIEIPNEITKDVIRYSKIFDTVVDRLDAYGFAVYEGLDDLVTVGVINEEIFEPEKIMPATAARGIAQENKKSKLIEIYNFVALEISKEAKSGGVRIDLSLFSPPISKNTLAIKKLIKVLLVNGYEVLSNNKPVDPDAKLNYEKMKELNIFWRK